MKIKDKFKKINLLMIPPFKKWKNKLWHFMTTSPYQRQLEDKEEIINELEQMRKEKISLWNRLKKNKNKRKNNP